jgi:hypothetical protein
MIRDPFNMFVSPRGLESIIEKLKGKETLTSNIKTYMYCKVEDMPMDPGKPAQTAPTGAGPAAAISGMPEPVIEEEAFWNCEGISLLSSRRASTNNH